MHQASSIDGQGGEHLWSTDLTPGLLHGIETDAPRVRSFTVSFVTSHVAYPVVQGHVAADELIVITW